jgi:L-seryl-tRNA(Ser) seleniumtransferase
MPEAVADGIDLVAFSGDKLLGGPQCGIVAGRAAAIARLRANPLLRALRVDKGTLAALSATLRLYVTGDIDKIPLYAMLALTREDLAARATALAASLGALGPDRHVRHLDTVAYAGGGSAPLSGLPSYGLAFARDGVSANAVARRLRTRSPRVVARVEGDEAIVDLRTIPADRDADLVAAVRAVLA